MDDALWLGGTLTFYLVQFFIFLVKKLCCGKLKKLPRREDDVPLIALRTSAEAATGAAPDEATTADAAETGAAATLPARSTMPALALAPMALTRWQRVCQSAKGAIFAVGRFIKNGFLAFVARERELIRSLGVYSYLIDSFVLPLIKSLKWVLVWLRFIIISAYTNPVWAVAIGASIAGIVSTLFWLALANYIAAFINRFVFGEMSRHTSAFLELIEIINALGIFLRAMLDLFPAYNPNPSDPTPAEAVTTAFTYLWTHTTAIFVVLLSRLDPAGLGIHLFRMPHLNSIPAQAQQQRNQAFAFIERIFKKMTSWFDQFVVFRAPLRVLQLLLHMITSFVSPFQYILYGLSQIPSTLNNAALNFGFQLTAVIIGFVSAAFTLSMTILENTLLNKNLYDLMKSFTFKLVLFHAALMAFQAAFWKLIFVVNDFTILNFFNGQSLYFVSPTGGPTDQTYVFALELFFAALFATFSMLDARKMVKAVWLGRQANVQLLEAPLSEQGVSAALAHEAASGTPALEHMAQAGPSFFQSYGTFERKQAYSLRHINDDGSTGPELRRLSPTEAREMERGYRRCC